MIRLLCMMLTSSLCLFSVIPAFASIAQSPEYPVVGEMVTLYVTAKSPEYPAREQALPDATVKVTYRPNSLIPKTVELPDKTREDGTIRWIPELPGLCSVVYEKNGEKGNVDVSVQFSGIPWSGIAVMIFAGSILYGGIFYLTYCLLVKQ